MPVQPCAKQRMKKPVTGLIPVTGFLYEHTTPASNMCRGKLGQIHFIQFLH